MKNVKVLKNRMVGSRYFSFGITVLLFAILYLIGMMNYRGFLKPQVFCNLFIDNAALIIATVGITFVLLIGGDRYFDRFCCRVDLHDIGAADGKHRFGRRRCDCDRAGDWAAVWSGTGLADCRI